MAKDEWTQPMEDALITELMGKATDHPGAYEHLMARARKAGVDKKVEAAMDRHAARRRAAGERGG